MGEYRVGCPGRHIIITTYLLIKRGRLELGYEQYDQQRSINLLHWCVLEISQFYLCFLNLIEHFYMPSLFFSAFMRYPN